MGSGCVEHMGLTKRVVSRATSIILLLFQSTYVLSTKKPGGVGDQKYVYTAEEGEIHSEQVSDITPKPVRGKSSAWQGHACSVYCART
jgi:hypothetical protein